VLEVSAGVTSPIFPLLMTASTTGISRPELPAGEIQLPHPSSSWASEAFSVEDRATCSIWSNAYAEHNAHAATTDMMRNKDTDSICSSRFDPGHGPVFDCSRGMRLGAHLCQHPPLRILDQRRAIHRTADGPERMHGRCGRSTFPSRAVKLLSEKVQLRRHQWLPMAATNIPTQHCLDAPAIQSPQGICRVCR